MAQPNQSSNNFHIAMFPWFAMGHITPFLHLSNELAARGHRISFLVPKKAQLELQHLNLHPNLISFHTITVPHVEGLPEGTEIASDIPTSMLLSIALDLTRDQIQGFLKSSVVDHKNKIHLPPAGYPSSTIVLLRGYEVRSISVIWKKPLGLNAITLYQRWTAAVKECDTFCIRTCREVEGDFCDYLEAQHEKPVLLTGPVLGMEDSNTEEGTIRGEDQFQELVLGFELTGLPFFVALKPPVGCATIEEALPHGFEERVKGRGVVFGGWVQQPMILSHISVGCFVSHCGFGSMWESLLSDNQIVLVPHLTDQILNTKILVKELKIAVEVEREENGWFSKESLSKAITTVMDKDNEVGFMVKKNHAKWRETLSTPGFMDGYIDSFVQKLRELVN
ncbi:UDP-glycosyltransferase 79B6-like [Prunus yedoensis var. nudiflora]|uniref:UDP-glycosyltransferase 79B6-like n=1 Tax=Prunus yedoensis var. nudiflora TaxID=2094558 RepID=A0A314UER6_PRUYE|nr:UDP-glycosyltransferase 79B6-like [Prunus yedoensis var. nudiflora]